jgi:hypothetical protein
MKLKTSASGVTLHSSFYLKARRKTHKHSNAFGVRRAASALSHPNICTVYEIAQEGERLFIAMEFVEDQTHEYYITGKPLSTEETIDCPYELGAHRQSAFSRALCPVYVRGQAYLALHDGGKAVVEFEKILGHRGNVLYEPIGALAHLGLARAYVLEGDTVKTRAARQDFLALWRDADPDRC